MAANSASLTRLDSAGVLRKTRAKTTHQTAAAAANRPNASRQVAPPRSTRSTQSTGVSPPMNRADIQMIDLAVPRCEAGNQLYRAFEMFGNAPASPMPKRNCKPTSTPKPT